MGKVKKPLHYFSITEIILWLSSVILIILSYIFFSKDGVLTLIASLLGLGSLIFCAKGNPIGQVLMVIFGGLYGVISYSLRYYGEMITYLGMTVPMAIIALVSWLKNPYKENKSQVKINTISKKEWIFCSALTLVITVIFYFVLKAFNTANLIPSTISVATSFFACYLTFRRSEYYALAFALNDVVLLVLWVLASFLSLSYVSVVVCFFVFLICDLYGFFSWKKIKKLQALS